MQAWLLVGHKKVQAVLGRVQDVSRVGKTRCSSALVNTARLGDEHGARSGKSAGVELSHGWRGEGCRRRWGCSKKKRSKMSSGGNGSEQDQREGHQRERFDFSRSVQAVLSTGTL